MHLYKVTELINKHSIDAAIFIRPQELVMLANHYPHWNGSVLVLLSDGSHTLFVPDVEPEIVNLSDNVEVIRYPWATSSCDPWEALLESIEVLIGKEKYIAINTSLTQAAPSSNAGEGAIFPMSFYLNLIGKFNFCDINDSLSELLAIKTDEQIERIKLVHKIALPAIAEFFTVKVNESDAELSARIEASILKQSGTGDVIYSKAWAMIQSGLDTKNACRFNKTGVRKIQDGDWVFLELSVCVNGYWLDLTRTTVAGKVSDQQQMYFDLVSKAVQASVKIAAPNTSLHDLYEVAMSVFKEAKLGHCFPHGLGHGTGFAYHDPSLGINKNNHLRLKPGQVLTIEPALYGDEIQGGVRIEENIVITDDGFEYLSSPQTHIKDMT